MKNQFQKGFTLIELLVVIAIIGILSSVVLASLNTARTKGSDVAIRSQLSHMRSQAALYYDSNGNNYGTAGTACDTEGSLFDPAATNNINAMTVGVTSEGGTNLTCANNETAWVVAADLKSPGNNWCADSLGYTGSTTKTLATSGTDSIGEDVACQ